MKKYRVCGIVSVDVSTVVQANSPEEAKEIADHFFGGISGFCGNGGSSKLIGVTGHDESIECNDNVEWQEANEE